MWPLNESLSRLRQPPGGKIHKLAGRLESKCIICNADDRPQIASSCRRAPCKWDCPAGQKAHGSCPPTADIYKCHQLINQLARGPGAWVGCIEQSGRVLGSSRAAAAAPITQPPPTTTPTAATATSRRGSHPQQLAAPCRQLGQESEPARHGGESARSRRGPRLMVGLTLGKLLGHRLEASASGSRGTLRAPATLAGVGRAGVGPARPRIPPIVERAAGRALRANPTEQNIRKTKQDSCPKLAASTAAVQRCAPPIGRRLVAGPHRPTAT
jgi:hypothetical protein